jgi:AraC family transcriptional regulator of arabinose operon
MFYDIIIKNTAKGNRKFMKTYFALGNKSSDTMAGADEWLHINNLGYYRDLTEDISIVRENGRTDYHLIYVSSGEINAGGKFMKSGEFCIFYPGQPQIYTYLKGSNTLYYWVHFTGKRVPEIFKKYALFSGVNISNGRKNEADSLFGLLTEALMHKDEQNSAYAVSLLFSVFSLLSMPKINAGPFLKAVRLLEDIEHETTVNRLAEMYHLSPGHFIRSFKKIYGTTPANFRISCQLTQAKNLLSDTELSVNGIAYQCGFKDPLYFSRLFKKHIGVSPYHYRTKSRNTDTKRPAIQ